MTTKSTDAVNHPKHYTSHPSGVECIAITEHMNFCLGNAVKYLWRAGLKSSVPIEDLKKAVWYIRREIARIEDEQHTIEEPKAPFRTSREVRERSTSHHVCSESVDSNSKDDPDPSGCRRSFSS